MRKKNESTTESKLQRRDRAIVQVRLDQVIPEVRAEFEARWDRREARARAFREIRNSTGPRNDANAVTSEREAMSGGMRRGKNTVASDVQPGRRPREIGPVVVRPDEDNLAVSDGVSDDRSSIGEFVKGPATETVDVGGVPTTRRRRA
jgi:hypothetical protein